MKKFITVTFLGVCAILMASCGSSTSSESQSDSQSQSQAQSDLQLPSYEDDGVSIFDSYSENQLKKLTQTDSKFANFYKRAYRTISSKEWTKDQKKTFGDLTYRRLYHYQNLPNDTTVWKPFYADWEKEWRELYGYYYYEGADSAAAYWKQVIDEQINSYAQIEPEAILVTGEFDFSLETAYWNFTVTPTKGNINEMFAIFSTGLKTDNGHNFMTYTLYSYEDIIQPTIVRSRIGNPDEWKGLTMEEYLKDHWAVTQIREITVDGVKHTFNELNVPAGIERLLIEDLPLHRDQTAYELNPDYVTLKRFLELKKKQAMEQHDPLAAMFFEMVSL